MSIRFAPLNKLPPPEPKSSPNWLAIPPIPLNPPVCLSSSNAKVVTAEYSIFWDLA